MRRFALPALILATIAFAVWLQPLAPLSLSPFSGQAQVTCAALPYTFVNGTVADGTQVNSDFSSVRNCINNATYLPRVPSNSALMAINSTAYPAVARLGFTVAGDSPAVTYVSSSSPCSLNSGNGDNGSQVKSADGKCWLGQLDGVRANPTIWGADGTAGVDSTTAVQAAISAMINGTLYTGSHIYKTGALTVSGPIKIVGEHSSTTGGFRANATNITLLTLSQNSGEVDGVFFDMKTIGANTSGAAVAITNGVGNQVHHSYIDGCFICIDMQGGTFDQAHNDVMNIVTNGIGVRVGSGTTSANTIDPHIEFNNMSPSGAGGAQLAMQILDAGGPQVVDNTVGLMGSQIKPGANQQVVWGFYQGEMGDSATSGDNLVIDTGAASAVVKGQDFSQVWTVAAAAGNGVAVRNTNAGTVSGIYFRGHRSYNNAQDGFLFNGTMTDVSIEDGHICGNSLGSANTYHGAVFGTGVAGIFIHGGQIGNGCAGSGGTQGASVFFTGTPTRTIVQGVDFTLATGSTGVFGGTLPTDGSSSISGNIGYSVTASAVTPGSSPWTTAVDSRPRTLYFTGGTISSITQGAQPLCTASPCQVQLAPGEAVVVTYSSTPTVSQQIHTQQ